MAEKPRTKSGTSRLRAQAEPVVEQPARPPFWTSLPGVLTGLGGVLVAVTGLITALFSAGIIGAKPNAETKSAPASNVVSLAATPEAKSDADRYKALVGRWEVLESPPVGVKEAEALWGFDATVSGNVLTLTGNLIAVDGDTKLHRDEAALKGTISTTMIGLDGVGNIRISDETSADGDDHRATIRLSDDMRQFHGNIERHGRIWPITGHKL